MSNGPMLNDWFQPLSLEMTWDQFQALPRHPAYRYEYKKNRATITGTPQIYHVQKPIEPTSSPTTRATLRPLQRRDESIVTELLTQGLGRTAPLVHLTSDAQFECAASLVRRSFTGRDGPLLWECSFIAEVDDHPIGAILITLLPSANFADFAAEEWQAAPPEDPLAARWGVPHLTWICVDPQYSRQHVGQCLLQQAVNVLSSFGYDTLYSTFLNGNQPALLWHWKMGFELLSHPGSRSRLR